MPSLHSPPLSPPNPILDIERLKAKAISAATFDAETLASFNTILSIVYSDYRLFRHFAEVAKDWFERPLTMQGDTFLVQNWSAGLILGLINGFCDEPRWPEDRLVQMKALWPHMAGWIHRLCECFVQPECPLPLEHLGSAFYYMSLFITRFIGSPMDVDFSCRFDKDGHFCRLIVTRSFLDPIIKAWVWSSSSVRHRTIFNLLGGIMKSMDNFRSFTSEQGTVAFRQALEPCTRSDPTPLIPSLQAPIVLSPLSSDMDTELTLLYVALTSQSSLTFRRDHLRLGFVQHVCGIFLYIVSTLPMPSAGPNLLRIAPPPSAIDSVNFFHPRGTMLIGYCLRAISCFLQEGQRWMIKAVRSNLLEALCRLEYWTMHYGQLTDHFPIIAAIWRDITRYIVHPRVFKVVRRRLDGALKERKLPTAMQSRCIVDAIGCLCMGMELLGPAITAMKGKAYSCSNEECDQTGVTRRCDRCELDFYCSRKCQRGDWKRHRAECALHAELYRHARPVPRMSTRRVQYFDALFQYLATHGPDKATILTLRREYLQSTYTCDDDSTPNKTSNDVVYVLDYTRLPRRISVERETRSPHLPARNPIMMMMPENKTVLRLQWKISWNNDIVHNETRIEIDVNAPTPQNLL